MIRAQEQSKDLHDQFRQQLQCSQDGFSVIADFFGRGIFNKVGQLLWRWWIVKKTMCPGTDGCSSIFKLQCG